MANKQIHFMLILTICWSISACSFKKGGDDSAAPNPQTQGKKSIQNIFEALKADDQEIFFNYLKQASFEEVNSYDAGGITPLYIATRLNNAAYVEALLEKGAIVLKPNRQTESNAYTLAQKSNETISSLLHAKIQYQFAVIEKLISEGKPSSAFDLLKAQFMNAYATINGFSSFIDTLVSHFDKNSTESETVLLQALSGQALNSATLDLLWKKVLNKKSLALTQRLTSLKQVNKELIREFIFGSDLNWILNVLRTFQNSQQVLEIDLDNLQSRYFESLYRGELPVNAATIKADIKLMSSQASQKTICSACVLKVLSEKSTYSMRNEIIQELLDKVDISSDLLATMVNHLSPADLKLLLSSLSKEQLNTQKGILVELFSNSTAVDNLSASYNLLKEYDLRLTAAETKELLSNLVLQQVNGNPQARTKISALENDILARKLELKIPSKELQNMASELVKSLADQNINDHLKTINLLYKMNGAKFEAVLVETKVNNENIQLNIDFEYFLLWKSHSYSSFSEISVAAATAELSVKFANNKTVGMWYRIANESYSLSTYELIILSTLEYVIKGKSNNTVKNTIDIINPYLIKSFSQETEQAFKLARAFRSSLPPSALQKTRELFSEIFLEITPSITVTRILLDYVNELSPELSQRPIFKLSSIIRILPENYNASNDSIKIISLFKNYLSKQNPRLYVALNTNKDSYKRYLLGYLSEDPLCKSGKADVEKIEATYQMRVAAKDLAPIHSVCALHQNVMPPIQIPFAPRGSLVGRDAKNSLNDLILEAIKNEEDWIRALVELKEKLGNAQFDAADIFGLKAEDLPMKKYTPDYINPIKRVEKDLRSERF